MTVPKSIAQLLHDLLESMQVQTYGTSSLTEGGFCIEAKITKLDPERPLETSFSKYCVHGIPLRYALNCKRCMVGELHIEGAKAAIRLRDKKKEETGG